MYNQESVADAATPPDRPRSRFGLSLPNTGLWRNASFTNLWAAESIAQLGSQISPVAIPLLAAITLHASPFEMGVLAAASGVPVLFFGFLAGVWVDRLPRKPIMLATDLGRALVIAIVPIAALFDVLTMSLLIAVSLAIGIQSVFFNAAWISILPSIVERDEIPDANGKLYASMAVAQVAGPASAGSLVGILTAPMVLVINAFAYLGSALFIRRIDVREAPPDNAGAEHHFWREIREGFVALFNSAVLRAQALCNASINFFGGMFLALYVIYMTDDLHLSTTGVGLVYASGGVGSLVGSMATSRISKLVGVGPAIIWGAVGFGLSCMITVAAIAMPVGKLPLVILGEFAAWGALVVFNILGLSLRQTLTPQRLLGRVSTSNTVLWQGSAALGAFLGGVMGSGIGVQETLVLSCFGMLAAAGWVIVSPLRHMRHMSDGTAEPAPA